LIGVGLAGVGPVAAGFFVTGFAAVVGLMRPVIVVPYHFAFAYNVARIVSVLVYDIEFVYRVMLVAHDVFVLNYAL